MDAVLDTNSTGAINFIETFPARLSQLNAKYLPLHLFLGGAHPVDLFQSQILMIGFTPNSASQLVLQGSVFGPLKCCVQIDTLGRDCLAEDKGFSSVLALAGSTSGPLYLPLPSKFQSYYRLISTKILAMRVTISRS